MRATGRFAEADVAEATDLADALGPIRNALADTGDWADRLQRIREAEEARAADAVAMAEVLAPLLSSRLQLSSAVGAAPRVAPAKSAPATPPSAGARGAQRDIADFIDDMIAQAASKT